VKVSKYALLHFCEVWFEYVYPKISQLEQILSKLGAKTGGRTWGRPSRPLYVRLSTVEARLRSWCIRFVMLRTADCRHFRFLVQGKRYLDEKFQKKIVQFGGCPLNP